MPVAQAAPSAYQYSGPVYSGTRKSSPLFIVTFVSYLAYLVVPALGYLALSNMDYYVAQPGYVALQVITFGLLLISSIAATIGGFNSRTTPGRSVGGGMLGILAILLSLLVLITSLGVYWLGVAFAVAQFLLPVALFLSWAVSRPFRGPGYFALLIWLPITGIAFGIQFLPFSGFGYVLGSVVNLLTEVIAAVVTVVVALAFEKSRSAMPPNVTAPSFSTGQAYAPAHQGYQGYGPRANTLAVVSLVFGIVGGSLVAVILGHIAKSQIRRTGETGSGMATAGLILGYFWFVILTIYIVSQIVGLIMFSNAMRSYGY